jgi:hypothetical protein
MEEAGQRINKHSASSGGAVVWTSP